MPKKLNNNKVVVGIEELATSWLSRWSPKRLRPLRVSWPTSWRRIGDTCLLDFVLKSLNNCTVA
ncbi:hypothetical protein AMTR_s00043p00043920 [Amborella trichopoda]|uniref:Uncharacterized protein n=1 Tax=Amborella trichopoda TaxID=13333 RepID=W1PXL4_AMBTC|nr:hypothetical protein AMTR_s00043p00043920 [Amborella trichopoda]